MENSKYTMRIREQKPIILTAKELDKMFAEHEKYVEILKSPYIMRRSNKYSPAKNPVYLPKIEKELMHILKLNSIWILIMKNHMIIPWK